MMKFCRKTDLNDQESLASYLYRISRENYYPSISFIAQDLDMTVPRLNNNLFSAKQLEIISQRTRKPIELLQHFSADYFIQRLGTEITGKFLLKNRVKYCISCFQENCYHKLSWTCLPLNICTRHNLVLIEKCLHCHSYISLTSLMTNVCARCGEKYTSGVFKGDSLDNYSTQIQLILHNCLFSEDNVSTPFTCSVNDFFCLMSSTYYILEGMNSYLGDGERIRGFHNKNEGNRNGASQMHAFNNAFWVYQDFPRNFFKVLNDFIATKKPPIMYEQKGQFEKIFQIESFAEITEAYKSFWVDKIDQGVIRRDFSIFKKDPETLKQRKFISKDEIRTTVGMSYEKLEQLSAHDELHMKVESKGKKARYLVEKSSFESVLEEKKYLITKREASLMLGIQRDSIPKLISAGLLKTYRKNTSHFEQLSHDEVKKLMDDCRGRVVKGEINGLKMHEALITYSVNGLSIVRIIQFTKQGILHPKSRIENGTLADNVYQVFELERCVNMIRKEQSELNGYYLSDVLRILKIGEKKAWSMINQGKLVPERIITLKDGRHRYLFDREQIEQLKMG